MSLVTSAQTFIRPVEYPSYNLTRFFYNPAYFLTSDFTEGFQLSSVYNQYLGVFNNQSEFAVSAVKYYENATIGISIERKEESSVFSKNRAYFNYGRKLRLSRDLEMTGALSIGVYNDYVGENATGLTFSEVVPDGMLGVLFQYDGKYHVGISTGQIFQSEYRGVIDNFKLIRNYQLEAFYKEKVHLKDVLRFGTRTFIDQLSIEQSISGYYLWTGRYGIGVNWRSDNSVTPELMLTRYKRGDLLLDLRFGYNFRLYSGDDVSIAKNSFMINLNVQGLPKRLLDSK